MPSHRKSTARPIHTSVAISAIVASTVGSFTLTSIGSSAGADPGPIGVCGFEFCVGDEDVIPGSPGSPGGGGSGGDGANGPGIGCPDIGIQVGCPNGPAPAAVPVPEIPPIIIASRARDRLPLPTPKIYHSPSPKTYVQVKTNLWINEGSFQQRSITITAGDNSVRATGVPQYVTWNTGEQTITCHGAGNSAGNECTYTYRRSSANQPGRAYKISATVTWVVNWTCVAGCTESGTLDPISMTGTAELPVGEIQTNSQPRQ